jgi:hypothetical protein
MPMECDCSALFFLFSSPSRSHRLAADKWAKTARFGAVLDRNAVTCPAGVSMPRGAANQTGPDPPHRNTDLMTDAELISRVMGVLDPGVTKIHGLRRGGRLLLALPTGREAAVRSLGLYQPQRSLARGTAALLRGMVRIGQHPVILPGLRISSEAMAITPVLEGIEHGTCGVLLGSPEHKVRRAIATYRNAGRWEVAKISFGEAGAGLLEREARTLEDLEPLVPEAPSVLGFHRGKDITMLRMPYLTGIPVHQGESREALELLDRWIADEAPKPAADFPEWPAIGSALSNEETGCRTLKRLSLERLRPVICHGDFARWNLLRKDDGSLVVLDWEWGHRNGMPGIDLVHYFLQDARLVQRLKPEDAIETTLAALESPACRDYLKKTGWSGSPLLPIIACLAYKQGAEHQENGDMLKAAMDALNRLDLPSA